MGFVTCLCVCFMVGYIIIARRRRNLIYQEILELAVSGNSCKVLRYLPFRGALKYAIARGEKLDRFETLSSAHDISLNVMIGGTNYFVYFSKFPHLRSNKSGANPV